MTYDELTGWFGAQGFFDFASAVQLSGERRPSLRVQLSRWRRSGKLLPLRRGMYALPDRPGGRAINPAELAGHLYGPSYLSEHWALGYFGLIPERVATYTSVTSRVPRTFVNAFGAFRYRHVKPAAFFGYAPVEIDGRRVLLAEPEKALLDLWHLEKGVWGGSRMAEMRFGGFDLIDSHKLREYARRFESARLSAAVDAWLELGPAEEEGTVEL